MSIPVSTTKKTTEKASRLTNLKRTRLRSAKGRTIRKGTFEFESALQTDHMRFISSSKKVNRTTALQRKPTAGNIYITITTQASSRRMKRRPGSSKILETTIEFIMTSSKSEWCTAWATHRKR